MNLIEILREEHRCIGCLKKKSNECEICLHGWDTGPLKGKFEDLYKPKAAIEKAAGYYADYEAIEKSKAIEEQRKWLIETRGFELTERLNRGRVEMLAFKPCGGSMAASGGDRLTAAINLVSYIKKHGRF